MLLVLLSGALVASATPQDATEESAQITTFRCRFVAGPRAGQIQDYSKYSDVSQILVGWPCQDGTGSWGFGITDTSDDLPEPPKFVDAKGMPILPTGITTACKFQTGPRAGEIQHFAPPFMPFRVGSDCSDGAGSSGVAVAQ